MTIRTMRTTAGLLLAWAAAATAAEVADGDAFRAAGRHREAIEVYEQVLADFPKNGPALYGLGICHTTLGLSEAGTDSLRKGREALEKLVAEYPHYAEYRHFNGWAALQLAKRNVPERDELLALSESEAFFALENEKNEGFKPMYRLTLAQVYRERGKLEEARKLFGELAAAPPPNPWTLFWLGEVEQALGNEAGAIESYLKSLEANANFVNPISPLSVIFKRLYEEGKYGEAADLIRRIVAVNPPAFHHAWALKELAENLVCLEDFNGAVEALEKAEQVKPDEAMFPNRLGLVFLAMGKRDEAIDAFRRAIRKNPNLLYPYENLGTLLAGKGAWEEARRAFFDGMQAARRVLSVDCRPDLKAETEFYLFIFRWNADQMEKHLK